LPRTEHLLQLRVDLAAPLLLAGAPLGTRRILYATGGTFCGPGLEGEVLPGGGDWVLDRRDGIAELDIRFLLRTGDQQLIYLDSRGIVDMPPPVRQRIRDGEDVDPAEYYFRTSLVFETGAAGYSRLNRLLALGIGRRTAGGMVTEVFEVK
jgi:hypothetical protein